MGFYDYGKLVLGKPTEIDLAQNNGDAIID
jgi:hypothetical protein